MEIGRKLPQCSNTKIMHPRSTQPSPCPPPPPRSLARVFERLEKPAECIASWQKAIEVIPLLRKDLLDSLDMEHILA